MVQGGCKPTFSLGGTTWYASGIIPRTHGLKYGTVSSSIQIDPEIPVKTPSYRLNGAIGYGGLTLLEGWPLHVPERLDLPQAAPWRWSSTPQRSASPVRSSTSGGRTNWERAHCGNTWANQLGLLQNSSKFQIYKILLYIYISTYIITYIHIYIYK